MKVTDLIDVLATLPKDMPVTYAWDGGPRSEVNTVFVSRKGEVVLADVGEHIYDTEDRPDWAPTNKEMLIWRAGEDK